MDFDKSEWVISDVMFSVEVAKYLKVRVGGGVLPIISRFRTNWTLWFNDIRTVSDKLDIMV